MDARGRNAIELIRRAFQTRLITEKDALRLQTHIETIGNMETPEEVRDFVHQTKEQMLTH